MNKQICLALCASLLTLTVSTQAQKEDPSAVANAAIEKMKRYQDEAMQLEPQSLYNELERLRKVMSLKNQGQVKWDMTDEDTLRAGAYVTALEAKKKSNDPRAADLWARYNSRICAVYASQPSLNSSAKDCWNEILESFKTAGAAGIARSLFSVGYIYENGLGVSKSNYLAADWYIKAADANLATGQREDALEALEGLVRVTPDHPAVNRLKAILLR
jgi:tetratricopeptide (TPR) repeat protein